MGFFWLVGAGVYTVFTLFLGRILFPRVEVKIVHEQVDVEQQVARVLREQQIMDIHLRPRGGPLR